MFFVSYSYILASCLYDIILNFECYIFIMQLMRNKVKLSHPRLMIWLEEKVILKKI